MPRPCVTRRISAGEKTKKPWSRDTTTESRHLIHSKGPSWVLPSDLAAAQVLSFFLPSVLAQLLLVSPSLLSMVHLKFLGLDTQLSSPIWFFQASSSTLRGLGPYCFQLSCCGHEISPVWKGKTVYSWCIDIITFAICRSAYRYISQQHGPSVLRLFSRWSTSFLAHFICTLVPPRFLSEKSVIEQLKRSIGMLRPLLIFKSGRWLGRDGAVTPRAGASLGKMSATASSMINIIMLLHDRKVEVGLRSPLRARFMQLRKFCLIEKLSFQKGKTFVSERMSPSSIT